MSGVATNNVTPTRDGQNVVLVSRETPWLHVYGPMSAPALVQLPWPRIAAQPSLNGYRPKSATLDNQGNLWALYTDQNAAPVFVAKFNGATFNYMGSIRLNAMVGAFALTADAAGKVWVFGTLNQMGNPSGFARRSINVV